ncbi:MAG: acetyl-CoA decarbonylase/synthase complex subunit gamma [Nitrososphaerota archaeon]|nr:acetyl-CoA decarbonylase/synthase complex subunit gamma [Nitrososphaerales archaeon]MDW8044243.1 acetyl-CoA decarbonylase/synthase complex subunit gamma [Nitrososphaerota archaeon]
MPAKVISPIEVYKYLPKTNCKECGEPNCMAFAVKLVNREIELNKCTPLLKEEYKEAYRKLWEMLKPPVKEVEIGVGDKRVKIGGKYVIHRHELTYNNPTAIAIDISDDMSEEEILRRIKKVQEFRFTYIGTTLKLDMLALRSVSNDKARFKEMVTFVANNTDLPLILCSFNPTIMEAGLRVVGDRKPLIYAATKENWREFLEFASIYKCPLAVFAPNDLKMLGSLTKTLIENGVSDLVLDPGTVPKGGLANTLNAFTMLRWRAINEGDEALGFPLMGTPITAWMVMDGDPSLKAWWEACIANMLILRFADLLIMHSLDGWSLLPTMILRQNIYNDPRKPVSVTPGLRVFGNPDEYSPVFMTTNFALTFYTVKSDIEAGKVDCYLLVVNSEGIAVECAVAGRKITPESIAEELLKSEVDKKVKHRILVIPGKAARLAGAIEDATKLTWKVVVGPMDSSEIPKFVANEWKRIVQSAQ